MCPFLCVLYRQKQVFKGLKPEPHFRPISSTWINQTPNLLVHSEIFLFHVYLAVFNTNKITDYVFGNALTPHRYDMKKGGTITCLPGPAQNSRTNTATRCPQERGTSTEGTRIPPPQWVEGPPTNSASVHLRLTVSFNSKKVTEAAACKRKGKKLFSPPGYNTV